MPQFRFRAMARSGEIVAGEVDAPTREEVVSRVEYLGHMLIDAELAPKGGFLTKETSSRDKRPRSRDVTLFLRQLSLLIAAGLTLEASLQTLAEDSNKSLVWFANNLRSTITAGDSFAEALDRHPTLIEPAYIAMVRAGEASGKLDAVLGAIVEDRDRRELLAERFSSAIRYPMFLVGAAIAILFFFLIFVVPQFEPVFKDLGNKLNGGAAFVLAMSSWLRANLQVFLGFWVVMGLGGWLLLRRRDVRGRLTAAIISIPGIAGPMRDRRTARFIGTLGLLVENGVALPATLKILRDVVTVPHLVAAIDNVHEQVRHGRRFADALAGSDLLPPLAVRMLRVGDETGDLASIARHAAAFYEHKLSVGMDRLMGVIGPATIILVSVIVGSLIVSIMSALLSITELAL
ncbi:type II secretion system F family protein [Methyloferula stellata]|uniref:type II secretion system F family protein n=1 Tax=Methyloferula stellata TaxID=876270 RepID=UPI0003A56F14|nr:type II secretion system F family protein [Methyloferula stellata]